MHTLHLDPAELAELIDCLGVYALDLGQVDIGDEDRPKLDRLHAICARAEALQRGDPVTTTPPADLTAEDHQRIGAKLADVLSLREDRTFKPPRYVTGWGTKTAQGLGATVARIVTAGGVL